MTTFAQRELAGWGRFPTQNCYVARPEKQRELALAAQDQAVESVLARGLGRSYGDAALNGDAGVILVEKLGRFLDFNPKTHVLHLEGGASLAEVLSTFVPRGYGLAVASGTKFVTIGGAIACDIHGKNHRAEGCFSRYVEEFELLLASGETITCSRVENPEAFWATTGGMGLTGIITSAKIRLWPIETAFIRTATTRLSDLDATLDAFERQSAQFCVAWIDCLASGAHLGRSVLIAGDPAIPDEIEGDPLAFETPRLKKVPRDLPDWALNPFSVKAFNALYYASHSEGQKIESFETFFWPLDAIGGWNRVYGARGFVQYQAVLPSRAAREGLKKLLETLSSSGRAPFLAVLKAHGASGEGLLSFPLEGYSLALDLPAAPGVKEFAQGLDAITLQFGGRVYLAKDSTLAAESLRPMYPRLGEFEAIKARLDPENRFASSLSRRLQIGGAP